MLPQIIIRIAEDIPEEAFELDFYIEPHKHNQRRNYSLEGDKFFIDFIAEIEYSYEENTGGDWDEIIGEYTEVGRTITVQNIIQDEIEILLKDNEKYAVEDFLTEKLTFKLY